jgi:large subunit ribosomal protein L21
MAARAEAFLPRFFCLTQRAEEDIDFFLFGGSCMYAIIETGGKQWRVEEGVTLKIDDLAVQVGAELTLDKVLMLGGDSTVVGTPYVAGAKVAAEVLEHGRGEKLRVFKKRRRNDSRCMQGHRRRYTTIKITSITA